ncbi:MAG: hypothetical protein CRN43_14465 [Candidatus Nephrothrix sp. EaCA]|nr:MAG: hypothetical protein CRN43_14465 [Candidatus Nephrothrix sp. EaCA]
MSVSQSYNDAKVTIRSAEGIASVAILDLAGRVCYHENVNGSQKYLNVDISRLSKGIYIAVVVTNSARYSSKVVR